MSLCIQCGAEIGDSSPERQARLLNEAANTEAISLDWESYEVAYPEEVFRSLCELDGKTPDIAHLEDDDL